MTWGDAVSALLFSRREVLSREPVDLFGPDFDGESSARKEFALVAAMPQHLRHAAKMSWSEMGPNSFTRSTFRSLLAARNEACQIRP